MKNIELTEEHKSKLLEMCKILFPEYTTIPNDKNPKFLTINWFTKQGYFIHLMDDDDLKENKMIHWFEFCMTYLQEKIRKVLNKPIDTWNNRLIGKLSFYFNNKTVNHPIDYLYEEFKKLEL